MQAFAQGQARAFERLLVRHRRGVFNFVRRSVGHEATAEDLFQEVFLRLIRAAPTYRVEARFTTWMYTIARNVCVDHARRAGVRRGEELGDARAERAAAPGPEPERAALDRELGERMEAAIAALGDELREVFLLRELANLRFAEIAEVVGCNVNTVKSRMRYALQQLRRALEDDQAEARVAR